MGAYRKGRLHSCHMLSIHNFKWLLINCNQFSYSASSAFGNKILLKWSDHITNIDTLAIYGKNHQKSSKSDNGPTVLKLGMYHCIH